MQVLVTSRLLTEEYTAKILMATMGHPKSAFELSAVLGIPIAACYRKIRVLEDAGFIQCCERRLTQSGKRMSMYKSNVRNANISFERNKIRARIVMEDGSSTDDCLDIDLGMMFKETHAKAL